MDGHGLDIILSCPETVDRAGDIKLGLDRRGPNVMNRLSRGGVDIFGIREAFLGALAVLSVLAQGSGGVLTVWLVELD